MSLAKFDRRAIPEERSVPHQTTVTHVLPVKSTRFGDSIPFSHIQYSLTAKRRHRTRHKEIKKDGTIRDAHITQPNCLVLIKQRIKFHHSHCSQLRTHKCQTGTNVPKRGRHVLAFVCSRVPNKLKSGRAKFILDFDSFQRSLFWKRQWAWWYYSLFMSFLSMRDV